MDRPVVLIPCFNDWQSLARLVPALDAALAAAGCQADVLVADDGSTEPERLGLAETRALGAVRVLRLVRNVGHQRAIAIGLAFLAAEGRDAPTVVMDADGEDRPQDVPVLLDALARCESPAQAVVFAQRQQRHERPTFQVLYRAYRLVQRVATGVTVDVGNFAAVSVGARRALAVTPSLWNHFSASVLASRLPTVRVPLDRGRRLAGQSRFRISGLVLHGLGAMSVFGERIGLRALTACAVLGAVTFAGIAAVLAVRFGTSLAIPGWATLAAGLLSILLVQLAGLGASFTFTLIAGRDASRFLPLRDHALYVDHVRPALPDAALPDAAERLGAEPVVHVRRG